MNITVRYQLAELLVTGSLFVFSDYPALAWTLLTLGILSSITRALWEKSQEDEEKKERAAHWDNLKAQLLQSHVATITLPDDDILKH